MQFSGPSDLAWTRRSFPGYRFLAREEKRAILVAGGHVAERAHEVPVSLLSEQAQGRALEMVENRLGSSRGANLHHQVCVQPILGMSARENVRFMAFHIHLDQVGLAEPWPKRQGANRKAVEFSIDRRLGACEMAPRGVAQDTNKFLGS